MGNWDPYDPVRHRTQFYERIKQGTVELIRFLPFYMVQYPGWPGKMFEPADCLKRKQMGEDTSNSSAYAKKEINEIRELPSYAALFNCEKSPDGTHVTLHSFGGWDWPR